MNNKVINPDAVVLGQIDGHWQKIAAFLLYKLAGETPVRITGADMEAMAAKFAPGIFTHGGSDFMEFSIVSEEAAQRIAAHDATMRGAG